MERLMRDVMFEVPTSVTAGDGDHHQRDRARRDALVCAKSVAKAA
jgi:hypothetical protein